MNQADFGFKAAVSFLLAAKTSDDFLMAGILDFLQKKERNDKFVLNLSDWSDTAKVITALSICDPEESGNLLASLVKPIMAVKDANAFFGHEKPSMTYIRGVVLGLFEAVNKLDELYWHDSCLERDLLVVLEELIFCEGIKAPLGGYIYPSQEHHRQEIEKACEKDWRMFESQLSSAIKVYVGKRHKERFERLNRFCRRIDERLQYLGSCERLAPISDVVLTQLCYGLVGKLTTREFLHMVIATLPESPDIKPYVFEGPLKEFWAITIDRCLYRVTKGAIDQQEPRCQWEERPFRFRTTVFNLRQPSQIEEERVGITLHRGIVLYQPGKLVKGKYRPAGRCSSRRWKQTTKPIAGLFVKQSEARTIYNSVSEHYNLQEWDECWRSQTEQVLKLIGGNHSYIVLDNELLE